MLNDVYHAESKEMIVVNVKAAIKQLCSTIKLCHCQCKCMLISMWIRPMAVKFPGSAFWGSKSATLTNYNGNPVNSINAVCRTSWSLTNNSAIVPRMQKSHIIAIGNQGLWLPESYVILVAMAKWAGDMLQRFRQHLEPNMIKTLQFIHPIGAVLIIQAATGGVGKPQHH